MHKKKSGINQLEVFTCTAIIFWKQYFKGDSGLLDNNGMNSEFFSHRLFRLPYFGFGFSQTCLVIVLDTATA